MTSEPRTSPGVPEPHSADSFDDRLAALGLALPPVPPAAGVYEHVVRTGALMFLSGGISVDEDRKILGNVGQDVTLEEGREAARICLLGRLAVLKAVLGDLRRVRRIVAIHGFVACGPDFVDHPKVVNGASELAIALFGDRGRHARTAVGCSSLPLGVAVELSMIVEIDEFD